MKLKVKKIPEKKLMQVVAPVVIILIILALFGLYHMIKLYKIQEPLPSSAPESQPTQQPEAGIVSCEDLGCPEGSKYIASSESNVYHECSSGYAQTILPQNRICFYNASEAEQAGYRPAAK